MCVGDDEKARNDVFRVFDWCHGGVTAVVISGRLRCSMFHSAGYFGMLSAGRPSFVPGYGSMWFDVDVMLRRWSWTEKRNETILYCPIKREVVGKSMRARRFTEPVNYSAMIGKLTHAKHSILPSVQISVHHYTPVSISVISKQEQCGQSRAWFY